MRRAVARGRMFPQSYSTDRRYGRLSLKAIGLFPLMWANADDQGRLCGDPEEIKYAVCPNIDHITKLDIPGLLKELQDNDLILCYDAPKSAAIQMLDWWDANQKMQWAWPSDYQPPEGWHDHLRYKKGKKEVVTRNWPVSGEHSGENGIITQVSSEEDSGEHSGETTEIPKEYSGEQLAKEIRVELILLPDAIDNLAEHEAVKQKLAQMGEQRGFLVKSEVNTPEGRIDLVWEDRGEAVAAFEIDVYEPRAKSLTKLTALGSRLSFIILRTNPAPLQLERGILLIGLGGKRESSKEKDNKEKDIKGNKRGRGRGNSPETSGEKSSPSPTTDQPEILRELTKCFQVEWGRVPARETDKIIPRELGGRETAQLRDLAKELSAVGGVPLDFIKQAFRDAAGRPDKMHISYARGILLDWLGVPRGPPDE